MDFKQSKTVALVTGAGPKPPAFDKQRILDLLAERPMTQEEIRSTVKEAKSLIKSALSLMSRKNQIRYSPRDGKWRLV